MEADYIATSGILKFKHQETSKVITVPINKEKKVSRHCFVMFNVVRTIGCRTAKCNVQGSFRFLVNEILKKV